MPKAKNAKADKALALYRQGLKLVDIARQLELPEGTVRRWKCNYDWDGTKSERSQKKKANVRKRGAQPGNHNAKGGPIRNQHARKFGFYSKYLPEETLEIFDDIENADPLDLLWDQIRFSYTAIVRAQKIAYVKDAEDKSSEVTMEAFGESGSTTAWEIQQAWDKQANFMKAQATAMSVLRGLIKQYDEMLNGRGENATEEQKLRLELLRNKLGDNSNQVKKVTIVNDTRRASDPDQ